MALVLNPTANYMFVSGTAAVQQTAVQLGLNGMSSLVDLGQGMSFAIGFDTRVSPTLVRLYVDIGPANLAALNGGIYGLVMTSEIQFDWLPVKPSVFSPDIAYQDAYSNLPTSWVFPRQLFASAINMKSPDLLKLSHIEDPYFAYSGTGVIGGNQNVASLSAPIGIDIDGPSNSEINTLLVSLRAANFVAKTCEITADQLASGTYLGPVAAALQFNLGQVIMVQMFNNSMLITIDDPEGYYPVFFVDVDGSQTSTKNIYAVEINTLQELRFNRVSDLFERFIDYYNLEQWTGPGYPVREGHFLRSYNSKNRVKTLLSGQANNPHVISSSYKVYCVKRSTIQNRTDFTCLGGVQWKVQRIFDKGDFSFGPLRVSTPSALSLQDVFNYNQQLPELRNFTRALTSQAIGPADQQQWFSAYNPPSPDLSFYGNSTTFTNF